MKVFESAKFASDSLGVNLGDDFKKKLAEEISRQISLFKFCIISANEKQLDITLQKVAKACNIDESNIARGYSWQIEASTIIMNNCNGKPPIKISF
mgnify:CR=1 FL=1